MISECQKILKMFASIALLSACASTPPTHFYVLEPQSSPAIDVADSAKKRIIGIGPLSIPALLERKQIITRSDQNTIQIAEFHQWAAPLRDTIAQVLSQNLAALQARHVIRAYPWSAYGSVDYRVIIDIDRFDTHPGHTVNLEARWAIMNDLTQGIVASNHSNIEHPLADPSYPAIVKALSGVLEEFGRQLSVALDRLK